VTLDSVDASTHVALNLAVSVGLALVIGKPLGILAGSWLAVRIGWRQLPPGVTWRGVLLVGMLGGIGFTMSIFIATLAFVDPQHLAAAKIGVLIGSAVSGILGLAFGYLHYRREPGSIAGARLRTAVDKE
jgi:NhaA family Na+:H+ antiporter